MKILYVNPGGELGGAERSLLDLIASMRAHRPEHQLHLMTAQEGPLSGHARDLGARVELVPLPEAIMGLGDSSLRFGGRPMAAAALALAAVRAGPALTSCRRRLRRAFEQLRPDMIHSNTTKAHLLTASAAGGGTPVVWHVRDFLTARPVMRRALRWQRRGAVGAIAISNAVAHDARQALPGLPVEVVYNAIDVDRFSPGRQDGAILDERAGEKPSTEGTLRVGLVATYARWKGHEVFLEAAAQLAAAADCPPSRFYIVGGPIYATRGSQFSEAELKGHAARLGLGNRVVFVGFQSDPVEVYRALDVVVHASTEPEPFGRTVVEAMACGRCVIVSQAGGASELFTHDVDGVGVQPRDAKGLAAAIRALSRDPARRERLGKAARATALARFARARLAPEVLAAYERFGRSTQPTRT